MGENSGTGDEGRGEGSNEDDGIQDEETTDEKDGKQKDGANGLHGGENSGTGDEVKVCEVILPFRMIYTVYILYTHHAVINNSPVLHGRVLKIPDGSAGRASY